MEITGNLLITVNRDAVPVQDIIAETSERIRDMTIRGAGRIARAGADAIGRFAETYQGNDLEVFREDLRAATRTILDSRPTAVSLWNGVHSTIMGVDDAASVDQAREILMRNARAFCERSEKAVETIARIGAKRIRDGDSVMTHCNSSAALGVEFRVFATESRPWRQGILTVTELAEAGVDVTMIIDSAVRYVMNDIDEVFVGADTITSHGAVINKIGTSQLALAAHEARTNFFVCGETYKFSPMTMFGDMVEIEERETSEVVRPGEIPESVKIFNPVFDSTPAQYIDAIITEVGMVPPTAVYNIMMRQLGDAVFYKE